MEGFYSYYFSEIFDDTTPNYDFSDSPSDGGVVLSYGNDRVVKVTPEVNNGWYIEFGDSERGAYAYLTQVPGTFNPTVIPSAINRAFGYFKKNGTSPSYISFDALHDRVSERDGFILTPNGYKDLLRIVTVIMEKYPQSKEGLGKIALKTQGRRNLTTHDLILIKTTALTGDRTTNDEIFAELFPYSLQKNYKDGGSRGRLYITFLKKAYGKYITSIENSGIHYTVHMTGF